MKNKKKIIWIIVILAVVIGGIFYFRSRKPKTTYTTETVNRVDLKQTVSVTGKVMAPEQTDLAFKISGQVKDIFVDVGDKVEKGQKVATIDEGTLFQSLRQAREEVAYQKSTLYNMKRRKATYVKEQEAAQRAVVRKSEAAVSEILVELGETTLYSPISGIVVSRNVNVGEITVANAVTTNTSVVTVAQEGDFHLESNVPESDIVKIALGQNCDATFDALTSNDVLKARVFEIDPASTVIQDVVYYKIKMAFDTPDSRLKIGMSSDIDIHTAEKNNVLAIPERVIRTENGKKLVDTLLADNTIKTVEVKTGLRGDEGMIEITSGLNQGDKVVTFTKTQ
jgi:RND family efflux transporter MFP subunit